MARRTQLEIRGFAGRVVPNGFWRQDSRAKHVVLVFPGWAYPADGPLLYYTRMAALEAGADVLALDYGYNRLDGFAKLEPAEQDDWFRREVEAALEAVGDYARYTLVGKSIGTQAVGHLLTAEPKLADASAVLLTPTFGDELLRKQLGELGQRCLTVIGTEDPDYREDHLQLARSLGELHVVDGADHSLNVAGSVVRSLDALVKVVERVGAFLAQGYAAP